MLQLCQKDKERVLDAIKSGQIDAADVSFPNLIDSIALLMKQKNLLSSFEEFLTDKRDDNKHFPFDILITLSVTAKLKIKTSLTDIPFAINDAELLSELGWNAWDTERDLDKGLFSENVMRGLLRKYTSEEMVSFYNNHVQEHFLKTLGMQPEIHILDCTKVPVNLSSENYEQSGTVKIEGKTYRGYKLGVLRGLLDDSGIAEEITLGSIETHDMELCRDMLRKTSCFRPGDILINDRGFLSRDMLNFLKTERQVDTYVPAKKNMIIYQDAVEIALSAGKWSRHPNKKRKTQEIQLEEDLGALWESETTSGGSTEGDVPINACVVRDTKTEEFFVFMTTDLTKSARQIIQTYELRPEIEEDFRQMKDFWKLEDFKSTKYNFVTFHIVMTLIGYLFFQAYKNMEEGSCYIGKSLPVVLKNHKENKPKSVIIYVGKYFGIFSFLEFLQIYAECTKEVRQLLGPILSKV